MVILGDGARTTTRFDGMGSTRVSPCFILSDCRTAFPSLPSFLLFILSAIFSISNHSSKALFVSSICLTILYTHCHSASLLSLVITWTRIFWNDCSSFTLPYSTSPHIYNKNEPWCKLLSKVYASIASSHTHLVVFQANTRGATPVAVAGSG